MKGEQRSRVGINKKIIRIIDDAYGGEEYKHHLLWGSKQKYSGREE
jgi:hypothetical protein